MILIAPAKSEKAIQRIESENAISFRVRNESTKEQIKDEFEKLFEAKVQNIRVYTNPDGQKIAILKLTKDFKADDVSTKLKLIA
jgi:ribosomal protein L23